MDSAVPFASPPPTSPFSALLKRVARAVASDHLTLVLLGVLATVLTGATLYEARQGTALARWYVYDAGWFAFLLAFLAANLAAQALARFPWQREDVGYLMVRIGLVVLLAGSLRTSLEGIHGQVTLSDQETTTRLTLPQRSQLTLSWAERPDVPDYRFQFDGGPVPWTTGRQLDLGDLDGVHARIRQFLPAAHPIQEWLADTTGRGGPFLRFALAQPNGEPLAPGELADEGYGDETIVGPLVVRLERAVNAAYWRDFLQPTPVAERATAWGTAGRLRVYHDDECTVIDVASHVGQKVPVGKGGTTVELVRYLPHARPDARGQFHSASEEPRNPIVELQVHLPGGSPPLRQLAFAKQPLLTLDGVSGTSCPLKFRYDHPGMALPTAIEFCQGPDGTLQARHDQGGTLRCEPVTAEGQRFPLPAGFTCQILSYLPHARRIVRFEAQAPETADATQSELEAAAGDTPVEAAAEVELEVAGERRTLWVLRNTPMEAAPVVSTPEGSLRVHFHSAERPLGFGLKLATVAASPPDTGAPTAGSAVVIVSPTSEPAGPSAAPVMADTETTHVLAPGRPLRLAGYTLHSPELTDAGHGHRRASLDVLTDPGRSLKYGGALLACCGALLVALRATLARQRPMVAPDQPSVTVSEAEIPRRQAA